MTEYEIKKIEQEIVPILRNNIRKALKVRGNKIKELSTKINMSCSTLHDLIREDSGKRRNLSLSTLVRIAQGLDFPLDTFFVKDMNYWDYILITKKATEKENAINKKIFSLLAEKIETPTDCVFAILCLTEFFSPDQQEAIKNNIEAYNRN